MESFQACNRNKTWEPRPAEGNMRFLSTACSILESARLTCCGPGFIVETLCVYLLRCSQSSGTMVLQLNLHTALNFMIRDGAVKVSSFSRGNLLCFCQTHQPLFIYLSVYLIIYLSSYLPVLLSIYLSIYGSIYRSIDLSFYLSRNYRHGTAPHWSVNLELWWSFLRDTKIPL